jgi:1-acyl-sn-glycerol-3-phosphate acyltransferase
MNRFAFDPSHIPVHARFTRPIFETFCRSVLLFYCPLSVEGREHLPELPFIICGNHNSHMDSVVLIVAARHSFDRFGMIAASDYFFRNAFAFHSFSALVNLIPLDRSSSAESFHHALEVCRGFVSQARGLILFPEGTRSRDGVVGPFKRGAAHFACALGLPIVPARIEGTRHALPAGAFFPRPGRVRVRFGLPIHPPAVDDRRAREAMLAETRRRILSMSDRASDQAMEAAADGV